MPVTVASGEVFDHVGIAVADLARRGVRRSSPTSAFSVLGAEPSHADAELVEWADWDIMHERAPQHSVSRGLHVGFRAPSRAAVDAFWQAGIDAVLAVHHWTGGGRRDRTRRPGCRVR